MIEVSILICTNRVDCFFYRAINSVLQQDFKNNYEIIIVLNGEASLSLDLVKDTLLPYDQIKIINSSVSYLNHSLNLGLDFASAKYIARMDADDISYPNRLSTQFEFMESNPEIAVCGSWYSMIDINDIPFETVRLPTENEFIRRALFLRNPLCHPTVMFRREIVAQAGGYLGGLYAEDYDLWLRLMNTVDIKFANIPEVLLGYRAEAGGIARRSAVAYAVVAGAQWSNFVRGGDPRWLVSALLTCAKRWFFSQRRKGNDDADK
ncbi:glycosyltransferase [Limnohabitans sp. Jir61]|uniref:glycosyltransferase n=1 Tax=Limnohabitans sp. Jir61 TaxID=1826168 RepID=UPI0013049361|nr:glycosyltransferase [Limnohabitans sp. Jir61]